MRGLARRCAVVIVGRAGACEKRENRRPMDPHLPTLWCCEESFPKALKRDTRTLLFGAIY